MTKPLVKLEHVCYNGDEQTFYLGGRMDIIIVAILLLVVITAFDARLWPKAGGTSRRRVRGMRKRQTPRRRTSRQSRTSRAPLGYYNSSQQELSVVRTRR